MVPIITRLRLVAIVNMIKNYQHNLFSFVIEILISHNDYHSIWFREGTQAQVILEGWGQEECKEPLGLVLMVATK